MSLSLDEIIVLDLDDGRTELRTLDVDDYQGLARSGLHAEPTLAEERSWWPSLIRLAISVEGPTEEEFVNKLIVGHLRSKGH